jgi:hypothetical protein
MLEQLVASIWLITTLSPDAAGLLDCETVIAFPPTVMVPVLDEVPVFSDTE